VLEIAQVDVRVAQRAIASPGNRPRSSMASSAGRVPRARRSGSRPPRTSCSACTMNSISRIPPGPSFTSVRVIVAPALLRDLAVDVAQPVVGVVVEVLAKHERRHERVQLVVALARERSRLEPRVALPRATLRNEVLLERGIRHGERSALAVRAEASCRRGTRSLRRDLVQCADDAPPEALEKLAVAERAPAVRLAVLRIDEDDVDVGRHVELAAPELAHADDHELLRLARCVARLAEVGRERGVMQRDGRREPDLGELRHAGTNLGEAGAAREIARHGMNERAAPQLAQRIGQRPGVALRDAGCNRLLRFVPVERRLDGRVKHLALVRPGFERRRARNGCTRALP
jgi:hypothetical protein